MAPPRRELGESGRVKLFVTRAFKTSFSAFSPETVGAAVALRHIEEMQASDPSLRNSAEKSVKIDEEFGQEHLAEPPCDPIDEEFAARLAAIDERLLKGKACTPLEDGTSVADPDQGMRLARAEVFLQFL